MTLLLDLWAKVISVWGHHRLVVLVVLAGILAVAIINLIHLRRLGDLRPSGAAEPVRPLGSEELPFVSVLVPARNEEGNIGPCVESLLAQEYPRYEVIVLDDDSSDGTADVVRGIATVDQRLRLVRGKPLLEGWLGKHWACQQLAEEARGDLLLFTDADTRHRPSMLRNAVSSQHAEQADLLTALPYERMETWAERLVLPVMAWALLGLLPLPIAHRSRAPLLSGAIGQFMLFRRSAYEAVGGHAAVRGDVVDDMALARAIKAKGLRWRLQDASGDVECRMYQGPRGVFDGIGKCIYPAVRYRLWVLLAVFVLLGLAFLEPAGILLASLLGAEVYPALLRWAWIAAGIGLVPWVLSCARFGMPLYVAPLYPLTVAVVIVLGIRSAVHSMQGKVVWKDRALAGGPAEL